MINSDLAKRFASDEDDRLILKKALDKQELTEKRSTPESTRFLSDRQITMCLSMLAAAGSKSHMVMGGYDGAERAVVAFLPDWMDAPPEGDACPITAVKCLFSRENEVSHRDILGAMMGLGIERDTVGDILVSEGRADIVIMREILPFVLQNLESAGRAKLNVSEIPFAELEVPQAAFELKRDTVSSLRLDSLVASGFNMSREKAAELIRAGRVSLDHRDCVKPDKAVSQGAKVSARGFGKIELFELGGLSKKGRTGIIIKKYI